MQMVYFIREAACNFVATISTDRDTQILRLRNSSRYSGSVKVSALAAYLSSDQL